MRSDQTTELLPGEPSGIKKGGVALIAYFVDLKPESIPNKHNNNSNAPIEKSRSFFVIAILKVLNLFIRMLLLLIV